MTTLLILYLDYDGVLHAADVRVTREEPCYPAFFADQQYSNGWLGEVCQALGSLPGPSKYFFLTRKSTRLGETPLEALVSGRLAQVLVSAETFRKG